MKELIALLALAPHPEGGYFSQVHKSQLLVTPTDGRPDRSAITIIYFLLDEGSVSRWHRVLSDEAWHYYEGSPIDLFMAPPEGGAAHSMTLGPLSEESKPLHVVPAGWWQAAHPRGPYSLVGCSVGPGFEFADFTLLSDLPIAERPVIDPEDLFSEFL
ncbi:MAG: cupin domain-containing protein [Thermoanaerobaculia bacterium]